MPTLIWVALQDQGMLDKAIEVYKKVIAINPDYAKAFNNIKCS